MKTNFDLFKAMEIQPKVSKRKRFTVFIEPALYERFRKICKLKGFNIPAALEVLLKFFIIEHEK